MLVVLSSSVCVCVQEFGGATGSEDLYLEEQAKQEAARKQEESKAFEAVPGLLYQAPQRAANIDIEGEDGITQ